MSLYLTAFLLGYRPMAGHAVLDRRIGVRIPVTQLRWRVRLVVRTLASHVGNTSSTLVRATDIDRYMRPWLNWIEFLATNQAVRGSNPLGRTKPTLIPEWVFSFFELKLHLI